MTALAFLPRLCRSCGAIGRFRRAHVCDACDRAAKEQRAQRIAERGLRVAPVEREDIRHNEKHIKWIKSLPCCVRCRDCVGPVTAHHVRHNTDGGTGLKPGDEWTVPICDGFFGSKEGHHQEGHRIGWLSFEAKYNTDLRGLAIKLASASPYIKKEVR